MTCKYPNCDREVGQVDTDEYTYRHTSFCGPKHDVKYGHLKADGQDAQDSMHAEADEPERYF